MSVAGHAANTEGGSELNTDHLLNNGDENRTIVVKHDSI